MKKLLFLIAISCNLTVNAQDYFITFAGTGASNSVETVIVKNLTQGTSVTMAGTSVLHIALNTTGVESTNQDKNNQVLFSPNPMKDYSRMQFDLPEGGNTIITLFDISGRKLAERKDVLSEGQHTYRLQGINVGIYFITIRSDKFSINGRLLCSESNNNDANIIYENTTLPLEKKSISKGINEEVVVLALPGDWFSMEGRSGNYGTVVTGVPSSSGTETFEFVPCTDGSSNNYSVVKIGNQLWMAGNLNTTKYNDNTPIPNVTDDAVWGAMTAAAYCDYNNSAANSVIYGKLYSFEVGASSNPRNVCPTGWHVPFDLEWTTLTNYLSGEDVAGGKLKETRLTHWVNPNTGATNETGFTALPAGQRSHFGTFNAIGLYGHWWSANELDTWFAWYRVMSCNSIIVIRSSNWKNYGLSIRCLRNN